MIDQRAELIREKEIVVPAVGDDLERKMPAARSTCLGITCERVRSCADEVQLGDYM